MNFTSVFIGFFYVTIILVLVWARFKYFEIDTRAAKISSYLYDPVVALHILATLYHYFWLKDLTSSSSRLTISMLMYATGAFVFLKSISVAHARGFAFNGKIEQLITSGTYQFVRHPLYLSYSLIWFSSTILFHSILLWITLAYLLAFYVITAIGEERAISASKYSREYKDYCRQVGMFLPRIRGWKS